MAGSTLTDNFWANDILWQLNVLAYNILVMIPQKKSKFKKQEHQTFIDWFIAVPAKITSSGHQIELKMYEHHFNKVDWEALDRLIEAAHTDGACHSPDNQNFCKDNDISLYLHAIQGAKGRYQFNISENRKLSVFDTTTKEIIDSKKITCKNDIDKWRIKTEKGYRYFTHKDILSCLIRKQIEETPIETLQIRNNVEATIFQLAYHYSNAKSRYRGEIKHQMWANIRCLWVNFVRILKYIKQLCQRTLFPAKYALRLFYTELYFAFKIFLTAILPHHLSNSENAEFSFT